MSIREYVLVHPHRCALEYFTMENMCLSETFTRWEGYVNNYGTGISSSSFSLNDFRTWPWTPLDGWFRTVRIVLLSSLTMTSMIKQRWRNASSTIFRIASASILLELPSKFFGKSCYSDSSPLLSLESHFKQDFEWRNILITPLDTPIMIKEFPLEQSYLLPDDLFCHPISYVTFIFTLFLFLYSSDRAQHCTQDWLFCDSVAFISIRRSSPIPKSLTSRSDMPACDSIFVKVFVNTFQGIFSMPKSFLDSLHLPPITFIPRTHWKLIMYPLDNS